MKAHSSSSVRAFFECSEFVDYLVLRPLRHIAPNWEMAWDGNVKQHEPEEGSFASALNIMIVDIAKALPPRRYHDSEDRLAEYVIRKLKWPITKVRGRWVGADYGSILEQGGFGDIDQVDLLAAASGRVHAALYRGQMHFDDMEQSHRQMLAAVLSIILYHRAARELLCSN